MMPKLLSAVIAATFAVTSLIPFAATAQTPDAIADACKGKKPGEEVTVDGNKVKCPAPKK